MRHRARRGLADRRATRSSTATGSTPRARRRCSSTATTTSSRSIRSTCGCGRRSSRSSRTAASTRAAPRTTRARSTSTCGRRGRGWRRSGRLPVNLALRLRRARRSPAPINFDAWIERQPRSPGGRPGGHQRHRLLRGQPAGHHGRPARPDVRPDRRHRARRSTCTRARYGGNVQNPANALATIIAGLKNDDGSRRPCPASTTRSARISEREHDEFARLPLDEAQFVATHRRATSCSASPTSCPRAAGARPTLDVNGIWGGFQGEGSRRSSRPTLTPRSACRLVADMDPAETFERVRDRVARARAAQASRSRSRCINDGHVEPDRHRPPGDRRPPPTCLEEVFGDASRSTCARAAPSRRRRRSQRSSACRSCCSASPTRTTRRTRPTSRCALDNYEGGLRTIVRYWQRLGEMSALGTGGASDTRSRRGALDSSRPPAASCRAQAVGSREGAGSDRRLR